MWPKRSGGWQLTLMYSNELSFKKEICVSDTYCKVNYEIRPVSTEVDAGYIFLIEVIYRSIIVRHVDDKTPVHHGEVIIENNTHISPESLVNPWRPSDAYMRC